ncbi:MAG: 4Fe-4S binding protein [Oligoflexia bacterium]|nr:4Fe-4S binding protein [Oligoflexia bacterium]MBF0364685.1 4Fe-4S binding protein [Oligoflexia bacterium]
MRPILSINYSCIKCDNCRLICPEHSIQYNGVSYAVDSWSCTFCNLCVEICPLGCIQMVNDDEKYDDTME